MSRVERHAAEEKSRAKAPRNADNEKKRRKGRVTPFGRFLNVIGTIIMLAALLFALILTIPRFAGIQSYVVVSGSMEPEIPVGSMVYAKEVEPASLKKGDIIVFFNSDAAAVDENAIPITHRVVKNDKKNTEIITKGDANAQEDSMPVSYDNVVGIVLKHVPHLGYLATPFSNLLGKISVGMIIIAGFLLAEVGSRIRRKI